MSTRSGVKPLRRHRHRARKGARRTFPFSILATFSEIHGKPYVEINTELAAEQGIFHADDEQPFLRLYVNDELVIDWPR